MGEAVGSITGTLPGDLSFLRDGYQILRYSPLIDPALIDFLWSYAHQRFAAQSMTFGDKLVPGTPSSYGDPAFEGLLERLRPRIAEAAGLRLRPTYSYFRLYKHGESLRRHRDRPACEISISLNIGQVPGTAWALLLGERDAPVAATLSPGDALLYRGRDLPHWREPFDGERAVQAFLHYVDADGPDAQEKFDRRPGLMRPKETHR